MENRPTTSTDLLKKIQPFLVKWKVILLCVLIALFIGYMHLRYADSEYKATATIKLKDDKQATKLPSIEQVSSEGLFSNGADKIGDEIEIIKSRTLIENVVKKLKLNIRFFQEGSIKVNELYKNPPLTLSFFANDSIIHKVDTTLYLKVKSKTKFLLFRNDGTTLIDRDESEGKPHTFGERLKTGFGDMVITPNIDHFESKIGSNIKISINPVIKVSNSYQKKLTVSSDKGSSIINLEVQETVAQKAIDVLNQLISEYNADVVRDKEKVVEVTSAFINNRLQAITEELEQVELSAEELQKRNKLTALGSQANIYLESEKQNEAQISNTTNQLKLIDFLQEEVNDDSKASDLLPLNVIGDPNVSQITKTYNELVAQRDKLLKNSTEKNPIVVNLNNQIAAQKNNLQNTLNNMKKSSEITLNTLNRESARIGGRLYAAPTKEKELRGIERKQGIKESLYLYLLEKREESSIRLGMYSPSAKIIDSAYSSFKPVAPNPIIIYLASVIFGLMIPIGLIYGFELIDTKIHNKEDLTDLLDIPYLGDVPRSPKNKTLIQKIDYSPKAEAFRIIRSNIDFMLKSITGRSKKLFITSTRAQEGKSHTSTNLATSISHSGKSVLLIETDIRVPKIMDYLGLENNSVKGLSDFIVDNSMKPQDIVIKHKKNEFLDIIASGTVPPNPAELLMSPRVNQLFEYFEDKYDYIIVDTSAVGLVSDTLLLADHADMFIYVVSADNIDKRHVKHVAKPLYEDKRLPHMTLLLNGVNVNGSGYGYGYGYGYGNNPEDQKKWYNFFSKKKN
ncbi:GumC family protein [Winogradskyella ursingii]|uniref:GumC family protein n=1 Tax=Winogradskyella ursingii TaxID=2686079 RepID=UPI0015C71926|nr:tyrosine-protein kinase family protein [Winogradskyella ursingii]